MLLFVHYYECTKLALFSCSYVNLHLVTSIIIYCLACYQIKEIHEIKAQSAITAAESSLFETATFLQTFLTSNIYPSYKPEHCPKTLLSFCLKKDQDTGFVARYSTVLNKGYLEI